MLMRAKINLWGAVIKQRDKKHFWGSEKVVKGLDNVEVHLAYFRLHLENAIHKPQEKSDQYREFQ